MLTLICLGIAAVTYITCTWLQVRAVNGLRTVLEVGLTGTVTALTAIGNDSGTGSEDVASLRAELNVLRRDITDIDERSEKRFRRLTARARREEPGEDDEAASFPFGRPVPPSGPPIQTPAESFANDRPPLIRAPRRF